MTVSLPPWAQRLQAAHWCLHKPEPASVSALSALAKPRLPTCNPRTLVPTPTEGHWHVSNKHPCSCCF